MRIRHSLAFDDNRLDDPLSLLIIHRLPGGTHADQRHGVQPQKRCTLLEADLKRNPLRMNVGKAGPAKETFELGRIAIAISMIGYWTQSLFGNAAELAEERHLVVGTPGRNRNATPRREGAVHLGSRSLLVGKELQSLLTDEQIEPFSLAKRQCRGIAFAPIDFRSNAARDREHIRTDVNADNLAASTKLLRCETSDDPGSAGNIQDTIPCRQPCLF